MQSFEELFSRYFRQVYGFALSLTRDEAEAEDLAQHTFYKALEKIDSFQGRSDPATWLCSIAKNEYFNRQRRKRELPLETDVPDGSSGDESVEMTVQRSDQAMRIHRHLHTLSEPYREVFMLRVFSELKYGQIASLFGKTESWARVTYYRAKQDLQRRMKEEDDE